MAFPRETDNGKNSLAIQLFGNRINAGQTLGEYLLEFLLVFAASKANNGEGRFKFHTKMPVIQMGSIILLFHAMG